MRYRLALDLGTSSIGLVAYALDAHDDPIDIPYHAVRIFQEPLDPGKGVGEPKKARRRQARQMRNQTQRKARRLKRIAHCLKLLGLNPENLPADHGQTIHHLRAKSADERIELEDLARVFLKISKRRGYAGGFKADKAKNKIEAEATGKKAARQAKPPKSDKDKDDDKAVVKPGIEKLKAAMADCHAQTLGQYLAHRYDQRLSLKLAPADAEEKLYAHRDMLEAEFEQIWTKQVAFHPVLNESRPDPHNHGETRLLKDIFHDALLFQRPLKSPAAMVGGCPLEKGLPRAPMAQPAAQAFRIEKQLADLRWGMGRRALPLSAEEKAVIRELLHSKEKVQFKEIYTALEKAGFPKPQGRGLNMDRASREELSGDKTRATLRKLQLLEAWDALDRVTQVQVINFLADLGSPEQLHAENWQTQFSKQIRDGKNPDGSWRFKRVPRQFSEAFLTFINRLANSDSYGRLTAMGFDAGRSAYSVKALDKLAQTLRELEGGLNAEENNHERAAIEKAYPDHYAEKPLLTELPPPPLTGNTVVDVALREVEKEIRKAIKALGGLPSEIHVELARAMALGVSRRNEIETANANNRRQRKTVEARLEESGFKPSKTTINKYLLWEEQDRFCPYCGDLIELNEVVDGQQTNIEHILPRSLTRIGGRRDQLVLAHRVCNALKTDQTPWNAWGGEPPKDKARWDAVVAQAQRFRTKKLRGRAILMGKARLLELRDWADDETVQGFSDRQFQETAWIAKHTAQWLRSICEPGKVRVSRGEMTAHLRRIWHLETVIPQVRFEEKLPVFDTDGGRVNREDFDHHRAFWEGKGKDEGANRTDRRIEKRIDHRHHLIDALVIGLCGPKLCQTMAREYKHRAERQKDGERVKLTLNIDPPFHNLRHRSVELVRKCNLTHKPDPYPDGALFKETAYGVAEVAADGKARWHLKPEELQAEAKSTDAQRRLTIRVKLKDFAGDKDSAETVRKKLGDIASPEVRKLVTDAYDQRIAKGDTPQQALGQPIEHPQYQNKTTKMAVYLKAVKVFVGNKPGQYLDADDAHPVIHQSRQGQHYKLLQHDGNACLEVWADGKGVKTRLLKPVEAMREKGRNPPNRFYKNDTVLDTRDGKRYLIRQIWAQNGGKLILTPITESREVREMGKADGLLTVSSKSLLKLRRI